MFKKFSIAFVASVILLIAVIFLTSISTGLTREIFSNIAAGIILIWLFGVPIALLGFLLYAFFTRNRAPQALLTTPQHPNTPATVFNSTQKPFDFSSMKVGELYTPHNLKTTHQAENFVAFDVETATSSSRSICQLGIAVVRNGEIVETKSWLIRPPKNEYSKENIAIHGITPEMTENALSFRRLWPEISPYLNNSILAAHYASFDINSLKNSTNAAQKELNIIGVLDSCISARRALPTLQNHKLPTVAEHFGIPLVAHDAESDATASAKILLATQNSPLLTVEQATTPVLYECFFFNRPYKRELTWNEKYRDTLDEDDDNEDF